MCEIWDGIRVFFVTLRQHIAAESDMGEAAGANVTALAVAMARHIKAFIALVLGHTELSKFNHSQGYSNDRRLSGMINIGTGVCASIQLAVYHTA